MIISINYFTIMNTTKKSPDPKILGISSIAVIMAIAALFPSAASVVNEITVIYTGETHAMLHPCDCPEDPGGGLAERAGFLDAVFEDRGSVLLLDGGGFSGGGIYDTYSAGRAADSVRTARTIAAMGMMRYDAVAVGDDDLQYGAEWLTSQAKEAELPLVCANCFTENGEYLVAPYIIVKKGNNTFGITSVVTNDRLFPIDTTVVIRDPAASLETLRRDMRRRSDYQILISHLGEEETGALLRQNTGFLLAANGHRKLSTQPLVTMSRIPVLNFGFQGRAMSFASLAWQNRNLRVTRSGWFRIDDESTMSAGVSERVAALLYDLKPEAGEEAAEIEDENKVYDLYIMSLCPYGIQAVGEIAELIRAFPQREWNVWFIGTAEGEELSSLKGEKEMFDEKLWLAVKALYPFRYHEFLFQRAASAEPTEVLLEEMEFDVRKIRHWVEDMGSSELRAHYIRSMRLNVDASPTLFVNNNLYDKPIGGGRLVREECRAAEVEPPFCSDYPECFEDADCWAPGKLGRCGSEPQTGRAVCEFRDDVSFALTVLIADSARSHPEKPVIEAIVDLLPGARVDVVKLSSDEGRRMMAEHAPAMLPFFHFEKSVENAYRFAAISEMLVKKDDGDFTFKRGAVKENYFPLREEKRGLVELYIDPLMPDVADVINAVLSNPDFADRVILRPMIFSAPNYPAQNRMRSEEALRWLILAKEFPKRYHAYLKLYAQTPATSYWFTWLKGISVNQNRFMRYIEASQPKMASFQEDFAPLWSGEPVMIMLNNRTKITVSNERELERVLRGVQ